MKKLIIGTILSAAMMFAANINTGEDIVLPELSVADKSKAFIAKTYFNERISIKCDELKPSELYQKSICLAHNGQTDAAMLGLEIIQKIDFRAFCMKNLVALQKDGADYKQIQSDIDKRFKQEDTEMGLCLKALEISGTEFKKVDNNLMEVVK